MSPRLLRIAACLVLALALAACRKPADAKRAEPLNLILVNIDTLRADHLGCYGYARPTSPVLDRLASEGVLFTDAAANTAYTRESVSVLFSGMLPSRSGASGWGAHPAAQFRTLAEVLRGAGYQTSSLDLTTMLRHKSFGRGFDKVEHLNQKWGLNQAGPRLSARALERLGELDGKRPFFLYLHYLDPHGPYDPPTDALARFGGDANAPRIDLYRDVRRNFTALRRDGLSPTSPMFASLVRQYDGEVFDTDRSVGQLLEGLQQRGLADRTLIVVTADHAEEFLEHGYFEHAWTLYEECIRVPLIFWAPSRLAPARVPARVSTVDLYPTILGLLGVRPANSELDGRALFTASDPPAPADLGPREQIGEMLIAERDAVRSVRKGRWKYLSVLRWLDLDQRPSVGALTEKQRARNPPPPIDLWGTPVREELYDLTSDPGESNNLAAGEPEVAREMAEILLAYRQRCTSAPAPSRPLTKAEAERMRQLGY